MGRLTGPGLDWQLASPEESAAAGGSPAEVAWRFTAGDRAVTVSYKVGMSGEQFVIEALRAAKALTLSPVAEVDGRVVGHIAFSPVAMSDGTQNWYGLGPVSVLPEYQGKGIGKALIQDRVRRGAQDALGHQGADEKR